MVDDADQPEFYSTGLVKARKAHRCVECRRTIVAGAIYRRDTGKWDGRVEGFATCVHCLILARWITAICGGYPFGELLGEVDEHLELLGPNDWVVVAFALARARRGWTHRFTGRRDDVPHELPLPRGMRYASRRRPGWYDDQRFTDKGWAGYDLYLRTEQAA